MKILLLEPHGDDALLSCHSILKTDNEIYLLTFSDHASYGLEKYYPSIKKLEFMDFKNLWYPNGKPILKTYQVHKDYLDGKPIAEDYLAVIKEIFKEDWDVSLDHIKNKISDLVSLNNFDIVLCPSAVVHPYHIAVREAWLQFNKNINIPTIFYADKYYIQNRYAKEMYEYLVKSWNFKEHNPGYVQLEEENTKIKDILWDVYPTEGKLLRFYSDIILWYPCKYMYDNNEKVEELINELE